MKDVVTTSVRAMNGVRRHALHFGATVCSLLAANDACAAAGSNHHGDDWPMYQFKSDHNAVFSGDDIPAAWRARFHGRVNGGLAIVAGTLYATSLDHHVYALDDRSGAIEWERDVGGVTMTAPVVVDGLVIVGTGSNAVLTDTPDANLWGRPGGDALIALNAQTGAPVWRFPTLGEDMPSPAVVGEATSNEIVFSNGDGHVRVVAAKSGRLLVERKTFGVSTMASLATLDGIVYGAGNLGSRNYYSLMNDPTRVELRTATWAFDPRGGFFTWLAPFGMSDCSPTIGADSVFVESADPIGPIKPGDFSFSIRNSVHALDAKTGTLRWSYDALPGPVSNVGTNEVGIAGTYSNGRFYESTPFAHNFLAFESGSGAVAWRVHTRGMVKMSAVVYGGSTFFGDTDGEFYEVDANDGAVRGVVRFPEAFGPSPPVIIGQTLYVANDATIFAIPLRDLRRGTLEEPASFE